MRWTIRGFAVRNGQSVIDEWMDDASDDAKAKMDQRLKFMQARKLTDWPYSYAHKRVKSDGLWEIKFEASKIAYRPLFYLGPDVAEITVLIFAEERNNILRPTGAEGTARQRMMQITQSPEKAIEYDG